ncbi:hypothetical protein GGP80_000618 [Salinibacter ruber]|uniref:hypothetical protein n=1 Tax=Salinibacter ruber TaxID=146919 RepID=UPI00160AF797|nr:hypothetical protein [Salinibacter ruber]MBB4060052.1 hypothetical protein [Salinibacter ruber]MCS3934659.1 hypothetical protein [Salinibacter ruber]MCS4041717.1 hypothetical protein [Salinibacter ruber]
MYYLSKLILSVALLFTTSKALSQDFEDIEKLPVKVIESCDGTVSSRFCYHVKERLRESERFKIVKKRVRPSIGLNILTMDVMESSVVYSTSITVRKVNSQQEIEMMVKSADNLSQVSREEMRSKARREVKSNYITSSIGTCASNNCEQQSVNVLYFLDESIDQPTSNGLKLNILYYRKRNQD